MLLRYSEALSGGQLATDLMCAQAGLNPYDVLMSGPPEQ